MAKFNLDGLREMGGDEPSFVKEMVESFFTSIDEVRNELDQSFKKKDFPGVADAAHRLAGPSRHMEMDTLHPQLKSLEKAGREMTPDPEEIQRLIQDVVTETESIREELKRELKNLG